MWIFGNFGDQFSSGYVISVRDKAKQLWSVYCWYDTWTVLLCSFRSWTLREIPLLHCKHHLVMQTDRTYSQLNRDYEIITVLNTTKIQLYLEI